MSPSATTMHLPLEVSGLLDAVQALVVVLDADRQIVALNRAAEEATGFRTEEIEGRPADCLFLDEGLQSADGVCSTGQWQCRAGGRRWVSWRSAPCVLPGGGERWTLVTGIDVTEERAAQEAQRAMERQLRSVASRVPALLWAIDTTGTFTLVEGKGAGIPGGMLPHLGDSIFTVLEQRPDLLGQVRRGLAGEAFSELVEIAGRALESRYEPLYGEDGGVVGLAGVAMDVTEQRRSERALAQAQKMESLGVLAGSVAHDFNNLLTAILGFAGLVKLSPSLEAEEREHVYLIEQSARRGADIAGRLLAFARGGLARFVPVDLRAVISETLQLIQPTLHEGIEVRVELPEGPVVVEGDYGQLQQSVLNIVLNARDAMPCGGLITVHLEQERDRAAVTIADTGPGMDEEVQSRIFEPFFTTKEAGSGTGLGLAITYGIIRGHAGEVAVVSDPGLGTQFVLSLPLWTPVAASPGPEVGDGNLVLVVDDDEVVRRSTSATLAELGYNVVEVGSGALAIDMVRARPGRFAAVLLDLVMPGMAGREVFRELSALRPDLPVVVCTGYAADRHIDDDMKRSIAGLLQKPFSAERLSEMLRGVGADPVRRERSRSATRS